jgi:chromate transporter
MSNPAEAPLPAASEVPSTLELFLAFAKMSAFGFGGVLAWARRVLVQEKRWMTPEGFNEILSLCQFLPGPNIVNVAAVFGARLHGLPGALACLAGLLGPATALMIVVGTLYRNYGSLPELRGTLVGLSAAAAGLFIATAVQMAEPVLRQRLGPEHFIAAIAFVAVGLLRLPLIPVLAVLLPLSIGLAWWVRR